MKKNILFKLVGITVLILFTANALSHGPVKGSNKTYYTEFKFEYINDKIIIPIEIEENTYRFVFDTGAPSVISNKLLQKITVTDKKTLDLKAANNSSFSLELVTVPEIKIGGVPFKNTTSLVDDKMIGSLVDCLAVDGSIGSSILEKSIIQILPRRNLIRLTNKRKKLPLDKKNATKLTLSGSQSQPLFWLEVQGDSNVKDQVFFDTGMHGLYNISNRNLGKIEQVSFIKSDDSKLIPKISLVQATFKNAPVISSNTETSRIGTDLLKYGNVTLNFKNKKFYFDSFDTEIDLVSINDDMTSDGVKTKSTCM